MDKLLLLGVLAFAGFVCFGLSLALAGDRHDRTGLWMVLLTVPVAVLVLWLDVVPGRLPSVLGWGLFLALLASPVLLLAAAIVGVRILVKRTYRSWSIPRPAALGLTWPRMTLWVLVLLTTWLLVRTRVPERVGFRLSRTAFEALLEEAREWPFGADPVDLHAGLYRVHAYMEDPRGGVYFRLYMEGFLDSTSYGFAYRPNERGSPFGDQDYRTSELGGGWFVFRATLDF